MTKVIPLKYGTIFKRVFGKPAVFEAFAEDVLGIKLKITEVHTEYEYPEPIGFIKTRYDLFAEDVERKVVVEIQHVKDKEFFDRFLYHHMISLAEKVRNYTNYDYVRTVYTIVVLTSVPRDSSVNFSYAVSDMSPVDEHGNRVAVYPHRLVFLSPRLVNEQTPPAVKEWLLLIADSLDWEMAEEDYPRLLFQEMIQEIRETTISPEILAEIKDDAAWEKAKARFRAEGLAERIEQGRKQKAVEIAEKLLDVLDDEIISQKTGLSATEVRALREQ